MQQFRARGLSLRRSYALCHISRSSVRYRPRPGRHAQNQQLVVRLRGIARRHQRYGYRRTHAVICREVPGVNVKRIHRLWRQERLILPSRRPRRRRSNRKVMRCIEATWPNVVWTYDVVPDACANGHRRKILTVTDEFTRKSLAIEVATTICARGVVQVLERLIAQHVVVFTYIVSSGVYQHRIPHWVMRVRMLPAPGRRVA